MRVMLFELASHLRHTLSARHMPQPSSTAHAALVICRSAPRQQQGTAARLCPAPHMPRGQLHHLRQPPRQHPHIARLQQQHAATGAAAADGAWAHLGLCSLPVAQGSSRGRHSSSSRRHSRDSCRGNNRAAAGPQGRQQRQRHGCCRPGCTACWQGEAAGHRC